MAPINIARNVRLFTIRKQEIIIVQNPAGAPYDESGKPLFEEYVDLAGAPVPVSFLDERVKRHASFEDAVEWCKARRIHQGRGRIRTHKIDTFNNVESTSVLRPKGMYFRSTPEMWERRGINGVTKERIVAGLKKVQHMLRMERQQLAASKRAHGIFV